MEQGGVEVRPGFVCFECLFCELGNSNIRDIGSHRVLYDKK